MKTVAFVATLVLAAASAPAFAATQYANLVQRSPSAAANGVTNNTLSNATDQPDGTLLTFTNPAGNGAQSVTVIFQFSSAVQAPGLIVYGLSSTGTNSVTLTEIRWQDNNTPGAAQTAAVALNVTVPTSSTDYEILTDEGVYDGFGWQPGVYNYAMLTFTFADDSVLNIDAVSNPEPGTIALFALGAAGLGGFAWKRRKTRVVARTA